MMETKMAKFDFEGCNCKEETFTDTVTVSVSVKQQDLRRQIKMYQVTCSSTQDGGTCEYIYINTMYIYIYYI